MKFIKIILASLILSLSVKAYDSDKLNLWIENEIENQEKVLVNSLIYNSKLSTVRVRIRATWGVTIPFLASVKLRPEVELYWKKVN
jgi:hypothetical protein